MCSKSSPNRAWLLEIMESVLQYDKYHYKFKKKKERKKEQKVTFFEVLLLGYMRNLLSLMIKQILGKLLKFLEETILNAGKYCF